MMLSRSWRNLCGEYNKTVVRKNNSEKRREQYQREDFTKTMLRAAVIFLCLLSTVLNPCTAFAEETQIYAHIGQDTLTIKPENNSSAEAFIKLLRKGDLTVNMHDYGNFEKVGSIGTSLPRNDTRITTVPGDVILYQGKQITIYYGTNTWNFTRLGKVQNVESLKSILSDGDVTVRFSLR